MNTHYTHNTYMMCMHKYLHAYLQRCIHAVITHQIYDTVQLKFDNAPSYQAERCSVC